MIAVNRPAKFIPGCWKMVDGSLWVGAEPQGKAPELPVNPHLVTESSRNEFPLAELME